MSKKKDLSPEMTRVFEHAQENDGILVRYPGGYWTHRNCEWVSDAPRWYGGTSTIQALVDRGKMEYTRWEDGRKNRFPIEATVCL